MVQTFLDNSLCIAEDTPQGRQLVFPSQYRRDKDIPWEPNVFVSYTFSGEWQTIWTTLVVRLWYSQEFAHKELWRSNIERLANNDLFLGLKIENRQGEGQATISLFFDPKAPDELKVIFIEYVHRHLDRYGSDVARDRRYICTACGKPVKDLAAVRERFEAGKDFITCQTCDERVLLIDHIEQRLKSDPVARKILAMEETVTRQLDTQALEQILIGHVQATTGEANQIFRTFPKSESGIQAEIEFKDNTGLPSGKKIYIALALGKPIQAHESWLTQPAGVYLIHRQTDEQTGDHSIRWMNATRHLKDRGSKRGRQITFAGEPLTMQAIWKLRDAFFPPHRQARA